MEMASPNIPEPQPRASTGPPQNLRNPLPLSPSQEGEVRVLYHKRVRAKCSDVIKDFADCARGRTISVAWTCRAQHLAMNSCMIQHANKAEQDAAREEWFAGIMERRQKKQEELAGVDQRRSEVIALVRKQEEKEKLEAERKLAEKMKEKEREKEGKKGGWWR